MREIKIGENEGGQRFDKYLAKLLKEAPKSFFYKMLRKKNITLNGKKASGSEKLAAGDMVKFFFADETFEKLCGAGEAFVSVRAPLDILYEDRDILLINKPAGMLSQKDQGDQPSLVEYLISYLLETGAVTQQELLTFRPSVCNRLDRNTSGIVACGRSLLGLQELSGMFRDRTIKKYYCCLVAGAVKEAAYVKGYLHKDACRNRVTVAETPLPDSAPIETEYVPLCGNERCTVLLVHLVTGKSHQIRSHLASLGHPLAGDTKYGDAAWNRKLRQTYGCRHQLLHGMLLEFPKLDGALAAVSEQRFAAPLPGLFRRVLKGELPGENIDERNIQRNLGIYQNDHQRRTDRDGRESCRAD